MRRGESDEGMPGEDSFLDVIANMVGIVIILVMVAGVRAGRLSEAKSHSHSAAPEAGKPLAELDAALLAARRNMVAEQKEVESAANRMLGAYQECKLIETRRIELEMVRAAVEQDIAARRAKLDADRQEEFDVQRKLVEAQIRLNELSQEQLRQLGAAPEVETLEATPTPIAETAGDDVIHVRLCHGLAAVVPVDALVEEMHRTNGVSYLRQQLSARDSASDVYGPIDGFRMRFRVERYAEVLAGPNPNMTVARAKHVQRGVFLPEHDDIGVPVEQALMPGGVLERAIRNRPSNRTAILAWVYPDSYDELRLLKRALWEQGAPLAVWPLRTGQPIEFSSEGSKAAAQ
ncbi:MAG: hypothetical protein KF688_01925 [Pirellulales bacterium]|nr:hypothetical protein [Pirellulales bacterium]